MDGSAEWSGFRSRVSRDHGVTWEPFTGMRDVVSSTGDDIDVRDDRYLLSNVDFGLAEPTQTER